MTEDALLEGRGLKKYFPIKKGVLNRTVGAIKVVDDVSFSVKKGSTFALVGESGCGKTTTGRTILRLYEPTSGTIRLGGRDLSGLSKGELLSARKDMQMVFQNPYGSLNPRMRVRELLAEPLMAHGLAKGVEARQIVEAMLGKVGLSKEYGDRYPHQFSGGQRQRVAIARALADEPVSALDVSIQSQILKLILSLREEMALTYVFISHDLNVVRRVSDHIGVMYLGRIVERSPVEELFDKPLHPYTEALLSAVPSLEPKNRKQRIILSGDVPNPANPPQGCVFHPRCPRATERCRTEVPLEREAAPDHFVSCHLA